MEESAFETARLTVRLGAVAGNYRHFVESCPVAEVAAAVKADAYGLGLAPVSQVLSQAGCDTFFVARLEEGIALRALLPSARILVLDGVLEGSAPALIGHRLVPVLNSLEQIALWSTAAKSQGGELDCAVHLDTGLNRLGVPAGEQAKLQAGPHAWLGGLKVILWMSHLACSDDCDSPMNRLQLERFREALAGLPSAPASLAASAGALLGPEYHFDLVRPGIGLYGGNPCSGRSNPFAVAAVLEGRILQLRRVDRGETVGYGATFRASRPSTLATIGLGYADGLMRAISNKGAGAILGRRVPVAGRVSMDLITLDVTDIPAEGLRVGTPVEFFGDIIPLEEIAAKAGTANYEVLTSVGARVPRHYESAGS